MRIDFRKLLLLLAIGAFLVGACVSRRPGNATLHRWWTQLGLVLPHDTFPANCKLCHVGEKWNTLTEDFTFDHEAETGVPLAGAHSQALCLRCHNDRGPVAVFNAKGCAGCHEDVHKGDLGKDCADCHQQRTWAAVGMIERHSRTRFPLTGTHTLTACVKCHQGGWVGNFQPTDTECVTCHRQDLLGTNNPNHLALGLVDKCDRCHIPTAWDQVSIR